MSTPVTISVTGCSTWRRVFISRKKKFRFASTRNSHVPAPSYFTARAASIATFPIAARISGVTMTEGDSSTTFWWRRWMEHSRSHRWT